MIGHIAASPSRQNHLYARLRWTSSQRRRSERIPKQYPTMSIRIISSGSIDERPIEAVERRQVAAQFLTGKINKKRSIDLGK